MARRPRSMISILFYFMV